MYMYISESGENAFDLVFKYYYYKYDSPTLTHAQ